MKSKLMRVAREAIENQTPNPEEHKEVPIPEDGVDPKKETPPPTGENNQPSPPDVSNVAPENDGKDTGNENPDPQPDPDAGSESGEGTDEQTKEPQAPEQQPGATEPPSAEPDNEQGDAPTQADVEAADANADQAESLDADVQEASAQAQEAGSLRITLESLSELLEGETPDPDTQAVIESTLKGVEEDLNIPQAQVPAAESNETFVTHTKRRIQSLEAAIDKKSASREGFLDKVKAFFGNTTALAKVATDEVTKALEKAKANPDASYEVSLDALRDVADFTTTGVNSIRSGFKSGVETVNGLTAGVGGIGRHLQTHTMTAGDMAKIWEGNGLDVDIEEDFVLIMIPRTFGYRPPVLLAKNNNGRWFYSVSLSKPNKAYRQGMTVKVSGSEMVSLLTEVLGHTKHLGNVMREIDKEMKIFNKHIEDNALAGDKSRTLVNAVSATILLDLNISNGAVLGRGARALAKVV